MATNVSKKIRKGTRKSIQNAKELLALQTYADVSVDLALAYKNIVSCLEHYEIFLKDEHR